MANKTYVATVQIVIHPKEEVDSEAGACDWFSGLLSEDLQIKEKILDWSYLKMGGQFMSPTEILVEDPYDEGDAFAK